MIIFFVKIRKNSYYGRRPFVLRLHGRGKFSDVSSPQSEPIVVSAKKKKKRSKNSKKTRMGEDAEGDLDGRVIGDFGESRAAGGNGNHGDSNNHHMHHHPQQQQQHPQQQHHPGGQQPHAHTLMPLPIPSSHLQPMDTRGSTSNGPDEKMAHFGGPQQQEALDYATTVQMHSEKQHFPHS